MVKQAWHYTARLLPSEMTCHLHILWMSEEHATGVDLYTLIARVQFSEVGTELDIMKPCNAPVPLCRIYSRMRTNWQFKFIRVIIPGHYSNDNDNDNQFKQCSSRPCSFGISVRIFWTFSKSSCTQQCPVRILFIHGYAYRKREVIFFVAQPTCCILVILTVFVVVLTVYYVIRTDNETGTDHKTVRTKTNEAAK